MFEFNKEKHTYTLDGKPLSGVTTVLSVIAKPMLIQWAANMAVEYVERDVVWSDKEDATYEIKQILFRKLLNEAKVAHRKKKEEAGVKGTDIHAEVESLVKEAIVRNRGLFAPTSHKEPQVQNFINWAVENKVKFLESEVQMYSKEMWTAGTADIICEIDGKRYVGDVKTSSGIYPEHFIQASAYAAMLVEMGKYEKFDGVVIINLDKKGGMKVKFNYDLEGNLQCFKSTLNLHRHLQAINPN